MYAVVSGLLLSLGCRSARAVYNMEWGNLRPESWRACPGWEVTWHAMASAASICLVLQDLVRYAGPTLVGSSFGTGAGNLYWIQVRVSMGSSVSCCGVPRITFGAWIGGNLGAILRDWIGGVVGATLGA